LVPTVLLRDGCESLAARHWLLGADNPTMADGKSSAVLTQATAGASGAPTNNGAGTSGSPWFLSTAAGQKTGLSTDIIDDGTARTIIVVARWSNAAGGVFLFGDFDATAGIGASATSAGTVVGINARPTNDNSIATPITPGTWYFVALSLNPGTARFDAINHLLNGALTFKTAASAYTAPSPSRALGLGDNRYNNSAFALSGDFAEFIIFNSALSQAEMSAVYDRSKTRLSTRGITLA
jgi:hypothetical protein